MTNRVKCLICMTLAMVACGLGGCATSSPEAASAYDAASMDPIFPHDWIGDWHGEMFIDTAGGTRSSVTMDLVIAPTDDPARFTWTITHTVDSGPQVRAYELVAIDAEIGAWAIDEKNGIVLESRYLNGTFHTWFDVGTARITVRERLEHAGTTDEAISFELLSAPAEPVPGGADEVATSFVPGTVQHALLRRVR